MTAFVLALTRVVIETWVRLYTLGLAARQRQGRMDLIRADLFDQLEDLSESGAGMSLAASLLARCLRGAPQDFTWRLFEARQQPRDVRMVVLERRTRMTAPSPSSAFLAIAALAAWAFVLVLAVAPQAHSLACTGVFLSLVALAAWTLEARASSGDEASPSSWPLLLSVGIAATAGGLVFQSERLGLYASGFLALGLTSSLARSLFSTATARPPDNTALPPSELAMHARRGDAIAIEANHRSGVSRRVLLRSSFGVGVAAAMAAMGGMVVDFLWRRDVSGFGGVVTAGKPADFPAGSKTIVREGKFWLVNLTEAQGGPGFLALWQKCPHLGCVVPWSERFSRVDPATGRDKQGWFRCPCHQSTYNDAGVRVFGPAPRSLDRMALTINTEGLIEVDTADISKGTDDNATFAVQSGSEASAGSTPR